MLMHLLRMMICACAIALPAGCSPKKAGDPQLTNLRLTSDLIDSLARGDHKTAAAQAGKLRSVLPESSFLSMLEESETANIYLTRTQPLLDSGDLDGAAKAIEHGLRDYPMNRYLVRARGQLEHLKKFRHALTAVADPQGAGRLRESLAEVSAMSTEYPESSFVTEFIAAGERKAAAMEKYEIRRAYDSLIAEYRILLKSEPALARILAAQIEYEKDNIQASRL